MLETIVTAIVGSGGVMGIFFFVFRRWIEKTLNASEEKRKKLHEYQVKKNELSDKKSQCYGRLFFWIYRAITTGNHNGELEKAFDDLQEVEKEMDEFERRRLAELWNEE